MTDSESGSGYSTAYPDRVAVDGIDDAAGPATAASADGTTAVAWAAEPGDNQHIDVSVGRPCCGGYQPESLFNCPHSVTPHLAFGPDGTLDVVWASDDGICAALRSPAGRWGAPEFVASVARPATGQPHPRPHVAVEPDGSILAVWTESDGSADRLRSAVRTAHGTWTTPTWLSPAGRSVSDDISPTLVTSSSGGVAAAWVADGTGYLTVDEAGRWSSPPRQSPTSR